MDFANILSTATTLAVILSIASVLRQRDTIRVLKENNEALDSQIIILKEETKQCAADHLVSQGQIAELKGQLADFRDLPLKEIQETQARILSTQREIVKLLTTIKGNTK